MFGAIIYCKFTGVTMFGYSLEYEIVWRTGEVRDVWGNTVSRAY